MICKPCEIITTTLCVLAMLALAAGMTFASIGWSCNHNGYFNAGPVRYECRPVYLESKR